MEQHRSMESVTKFGVLKTSLQATRNDKVIELRGECTDYMAALYASRRLRCRVL